MSSHKALKDPLLSITDLVKLLRISEATIYRRIKDGKFPKAIELGPQVRRWRSCTIQKWIVEQAALADQAP